MKALRVWLLKKRLHRAYSSYLKGLDRLGCGRQLAEEISPQVAKYKARCNKTLARLAALDPKNCPVTRIG